MLFCARLILPGAIQPKPQRTRRCGLYFIFSSPSSKALYNSPVRTPMANSCRERLRPAQGHFRHARQTSDLPTAGPQLSPPEPTSNPRRQHTTWVPAHQASSIKDGKAIEHGTSFPRSVRMTSVPGRHLLKCNKTSNAFVS